MVHVNVPALVYDCDPAFVNCEKTRESVPTTEPDVHTHIVRAYEVPSTIGTNAYVATLPVMVSDARDHALALTT